MRSLFGRSQDQEHTFNWKELSQWEADQEAMAFCFEYTKEGKKPRWVKVYSEYVRIFLVLLFSKWATGFAENTGS